MLIALYLLTLQSPIPALASTSADSTLPDDAVVKDEAWIRRAEGPPGARRYLASQSLRALVGDLDGDGVPDLPSDVDALCHYPRNPGSATAPHDFLFSTVSGGPGYADGDLLRLAPGGGLEVVVAETEFLAVLQPLSGSFDLDAVTSPGTDFFWFSVADNLTGTVLGDVADGDVLSWDRAAGILQRIHTEAGIQAMVDTAEAAPAPAVGDVLSLSVYPGSGELAFSVQSPSANDATVYGSGGGGRVLPGWHEADWAFQSSTELDALAFAPGALPQPPVLETDLSEGGPGTLVQFTLSHGTPGAMAEGFAAGTPGFQDRPGEGIGFFGLDHGDALFQRLLQRGSFHRQPLDAAGRRSFPWILPARRSGSTRLDLWFQARDRSAWSWSAPILLSVL